MMPNAYYREKRADLNRLEICQKCGAKDREFPYSCCTSCRKQQKAMDARRSKEKRGVEI